jgi:hypothetical protein
MSLFSTDPLGRLTVSNHWVPYMKVIGKHMKNLKVLVGARLQLVLMIYTNRFPCVTGFLESCRSKRAPTSPDDC